MRMRAWSARVYADAGTRHLGTAWSVQLVEQPVCLQAMNEGAGRAGSGPLCRSVRMKAVMNRGEPPGCAQKGKYDVVKLSSWTRPAA